MTTKKTNPAPLTIEVVNTRTIGDLLTRTKGLLELIELACETAADKVIDDVGDVLHPDLCKSLAKMCSFAAQDLDLMEIYLSKDAADFHQNQIEELAAQAPGRQTAETTPAPQE